MYVMPRGRGLAARVFLKMSKLRTFIKQHVLWVGLLAVVVPLIAILGLQYRSLRRLEQTSIIEGTVGMKNYLNDVYKETKNFYKAKADEMLSIPAYSVQGESLSRVKYHFSQCQFEGFKHLFVASFGPDGESRVLFFDGRGQKMIGYVPPGESHAELRADSP